MSKPMSRKGGKRDHAHESREQRAAGWTARVQGLAKDRIQGGVKLGKAARSAWPTPEDWARRRAHASQRSSRSKPAG